MRKKTTILFSIAASLTMLFFVLPAFANHGNLSSSKLFSSLYPCAKFKNAKQSGTMCRAGSENGFWVGPNADTCVTPTDVGGDKTGEGKKFNCHGTSLSEWWVPANTSDCDTTNSSSDYTNCTTPDACITGQTQATLTCYKSSNSCNGPASITKTKSCCSSDDYSVAWGSCNEGAADITQAAPNVPQPKKSQVRQRTQAAATKDCVDTVFTPQIQNCCSHDVTSCTSYSVCSVTYISTDGSKVDGKKSRSCTSYQCADSDLTKASNTSANPNPAIEEQSCTACAEAAPPYGTPISTGCTSQGKQFVRYSVPASTSQCSFRVDNPESTQTKYHEVVTTIACDQCAEPSESSDGQYSCNTTSKCVGPTADGNGKYSCPTNPVNPNSGKCDPAKTVSENELRYYQCTVLPGLQCYSPQGEHYAVRWCRVCSDAELMTAWSACLLPNPPTQSSDGLYYGKQTRAVKPASELGQLNCAAPTSAYIIERECTKKAEEISIVSPGTPIDPQTNFPTGEIHQTLRYDGEDWIASGLLINNTSAIGIGMKTPQSMLHIYGGQTWGSDLSIDASAPSLGGHRWILASIGGNATEKAGAFLIKDQTVENGDGALRLIIDASGNVGIPGNVQIGNGIILNGSGSATIASQLSIGSRNDKAPDGALRILSTASNKDANLVMQGAGLGDSWLWVAGGTDDDANTVDTPHDLILQTKTYSGTAWGDETEIGRFNTSGLTLNGREKALKFEFTESNTNYAASISHDGNNNLNLTAGASINLTGGTALNFKAGSVGFKNSIGTQTLFIDGSGNVGIGTTDTKFARLAVVESATEQTNGLFVYVKNGKTILSTSAFDANTASGAQKSRLDARQAQIGGADEIQKEKNRIDAVPTFTLQPNSEIKLDPNFSKDQVGGPNPDIQVDTLSLCQQDAAIGNFSLTGCEEDEKDPKYMAVYNFYDAKIPGTETKYSDKLCPCASSASDIPIYSALTNSKKGRGCQQKSFKLDFDKGSVFRQKDEALANDQYGRYGRAQTLVATQENQMTALKPVSNDSFCYDFWKEAETYYYDDSDKTNNRPKKQSWTYHIDVYKASDAPTTGQ